MAFDEASKLFELYIDWNRRLKREIPFVESLLRRAGARNVADVACGTGAHAAALAEAGFEVTGMDPDETLLEQARARCAEVTLEQAAFADLPGKAASSFDAALCLGNSLALVEPGRELAQALEGLGSLLKPGGLVLLHTINFPMLARRGKDPWGPVRTLNDGSLMLKGFLPRAEGSWEALLIHIQKGEKLRTARFALHPHGPEQVRRAGEGAGLNLTAIHGGFAGEAHDEPGSADLIYHFVRQ